MANDGNLRAALGYRRMGWIPIPLCWPENGKCGCGGGHTGKNIGKAPIVGKGWQNLRPDEEEIRKWWTQWPKANIGILLEPSGLAVIDPDSQEALREVEQLGIPTNTPTARTGKGKHFYFVAPSDAKRVTKKGKSKAIDILAKGYTVAPPSIHRNGKQYTWEISPEDEGVRHLPPWAASYFGEEPPVDQVEGPGFEEVLARNRGKIPRKVLSVLLADHAPVGKRSDTLWWLQHELVKAGLSRRDIFTLVRESVWNKYRGRKDEIERLEHELAAALEHEVVDKPSREEEERSLELYIENFPSLMGDLSYHPGWLVEGFWTRESHGIIAGEPKSFKTTIALDMAVAIASGGKFLGEFQTIEQGPVLIIQNENAPWILKDRLEKITAARGLVGKVRRTSEGLFVTFPSPLPLYFINQQGVNLLDPIYQKTLEKAIKTLDPVLIILDPLYLMFDGDVNSAKDLNPVLNWLLRIKNDYGIGVMLIHHMNKGGNRSGVVRGGQRMLGSTTLHGWVESALYISSREEEEEETEEDEGAYNGKLESGGAGSAKITVEREFRGAGMYPRLDIQIKMGEFGSPDYSVVVEKHQPRDRRRKVSRDQIRDDILNFLGMQTERVGIRRLVPQIGISRDKIREILQELKAEGKVDINKQGVRLVK